jgi:hypothetical protein
MLDVDIAKTELYEENLSACAVKDLAVLFKAKGDPVSGLMEAISKCGATLEGSSLACRTAGKALSLLCVHAKVKEVFAQTLRRNALAVFKQEKVICRWNFLVDKLQEKTDMTLYEKAVADIANPAKAYVTLKVLCAKQPNHPEKVRERFISKQPNEL